MKMYFLFDVGGTHLRAAVANSQRILRQIKVPTPKTARQGIQTLNTLAVQLSKGQKFEAAAGGLAGTLDQRKTKLNRAPNLPGWIRFPIRQTLQYRWHVPVQLENDAALAALAEARTGAGRKFQRVAFITVGTGLGGCLMIKKKFDPLTYGQEPGQFQIAVESRTDNWEHWISGRAIEHRYHQKAERLRSVKEWQNLRKHFIQGLEVVVQRWQPDVIVLGGSVMRRLWPLPNKTLRKKQAYWPLIRRSYWADRATLQGARLLLSQQ